MANINISQHKGTLFPSILNIEGGAVYGDQIYWGEGSTFGSTEFTTTSELLTAIETEIGSGAFDEGAVNDLISAYYTSYALKTTDVNDLVSAYYTSYALKTDDVNNLISAYYSSYVAEGILSTSDVEEVAIAYCESYKTDMESYVVSYCAEYYANHTITDDDIATKIDNYITEQGVIPTLSKGEVTVDSSKKYFISDFTVNNHTITPVYTEYNAHPAAIELWGNYVGNIYDVASVSFSGLNEADGVITTTPAAGLSFAIDDTDVANAAGYNVSVALYGIPQEQHTDDDIDLDGSMSVPEGPVLINEGMFTSDSPSFMNLYTNELEEGYQYGLVINYCEVLDANGDILAKYILDYNSPSITVGADAE